MELRSPDPTCNPYLTFAAILAAGLDGIKKQLTPPAGVVQNIYEMTAEERMKAHIDTLPGDLITANRDLLEDPLICDVLGSHVINGLNSIAQMEWDSFRTAVHPWEVDRYLAMY